MNRSMTWWIRAFLISSALRGLLLGINGLLNYHEISIPLQFTPLNAAFVAGLYLAGTIGLILTLDEGRSPGSFHPRLSSSVLRRSSKSRQKYVVGCTHFSILSRDHLHTRRTFFIYAIACWPL